MAQTGEDIPLKFPAYNGMKGQQRFIIVKEMRAQELITLQVDQEPVGGAFLQKAVILAHRAQAGL